MGRFEESLAEYRRCHELGSRKKGWPDPSALWVQRAERLVVMDQKLPKVLAGEEKPADLLETLDLAEVAYYRRWYAASARLYAHAMLLDPKLANQVNGARYLGACAGVLAGSGRGEVADKLSESEQGKWRRQVLRWLTAELAGLTERAEQPAARAMVRVLLNHWRIDPDLAPVRDEGELKKLPEAEQDQWRKLWAEHARLQARLVGPAVAPPPRAKMPP